MLTNKNKYGIIGYNLKRKERKKVMENKKEFVKEYGEFLAKFGIQDIAKMEYIEEPNGEEWCEITYTSGHIKRVCVTCDSMWCIVMDTVQSL